MRVPKQFLRPPVGQMLDQAFARDPEAFRRAVEKLKERTNPCECECHYQLHDHEPDCSCQCHEGAD